MRASGRGLPPAGFARHGALSHDLLQLAAETWHYEVREQPRRREEGLETGRRSPVPSSDPPRRAPRSAPKSHGHSFIIRGLVKAQQALVQGVDQAPGGSHLEIQAFLST